MPETAQSKVKPKFIPSFVWSVITFFGNRPVPTESVPPAVQKIMEQLSRGEKPTSQYVPDTKQKR